MRRHVGIGASVGLALWLATGPAAAQDPAASIDVTFDASARALPQDDIRAAIARELGAELAPPGAPSARELTISLVNGELSVRFRSPAGVTERRTALSGDPAEVAVVLSFIAVNLVRDQRSLIESAPDPLPPEPAPVASPALATAAAPIVDPWSPDARSERFSRHWLGLHVAQDFLLEAGLATTRLLLSYDYALIPSLTLGGRLGYAFGGGPPMASSPFFSPHIEARATYWYPPLTNPDFRAYLGTSIGFLEIDAPIGSQASWKRLGQEFLGLHGGTLVLIAQNLSVALNLDVIVTLPDTGFAVEPSLGFVYGL